MPSRGLPENIDSAYADDATHADVKTHQQHHDVIHDFVNLFDDATPGNGYVAFFNTTSGLWEYLDPAISGSPGPQGIQGHGVRWLGAWSGATAYTIYNGTSVFADDLVSFNGDTYIALAAHTNSQPPSANWALLAASGADGADGADGATGADGAEGPPGPSEETLLVTPSSGGTFTLDVSAATVHEVTLSTDCAFTLSAPLTGAAALTVILHQGAGSNAVSFTNEVAWEGGTEPTYSTGAGEADVLTFMSVTGVWYGFASAIGIPSPLSLLSPTLAASAAATTSHTSLATPGNVTCADGDMLIVGILTTRSAGTPTVPTVTGAGMSSFSQLGSQQVWNTGSQNKALTMFGAYQASAGSPAAVTVDYGGTTQTGTAFLVIQIVGAKSTCLTLANSAFVTANNVGSPSTSISVTLGAASDSDNRGISFVVTNAGNGITPRTNWTELGEVIPTVPNNMTLEAQWRSDAFETTASGSMTSGSSGPMGIMATELEQG